jgi:hypothetical protein
MFGVERFNLTKLNDMVLKEQYEVKITNCSAALEILDDNDDDYVTSVRLRKVLERIQKFQPQRFKDIMCGNSINVRFMKCSKSLAQRKQAKF